MPKTIFTGANQVVVAAIRRERERMGLTQTELAQRIGKEQSWVSLVENSQRRLDVVEFISLAEALDADPAALLSEIVQALP